MDDKNREFENQMDNAIGNLASIQEDIEDRDISETLNRIINWMENVTDSEMLPNTRYSYLNRIIESLLYVREELPIESSSAEQDLAQVVVVVMNAGHNIGLTLVHSYYERLPRQLAIEEVPPPYS